MSSVHVAPQQHKQPSRKGKRAWRKNVDLAEVESGLENAREELIQGGIYAERPADELFTIDTTGSEQVKQDYAKKNKQLKADDIIAARSSAIPAIDSRKRKTIESVTDPSAKRVKDNSYVSAKDLRRLKAAAYNPEAIQERSGYSKDVTHDPWAEQPVIEDPRFSFLEKKQAKREPVTLKQKPISLAANGKATAAVSRPEAGKSYNPDFNAWQELLDRKGEQEVEAERKRLQEARDEAEKTEKALAEAAKPDPASDDEEYESAWESEWEGIQSENEEQASWLNKKRPERKTPAERNKVKRRKEAERQAKWEAQMKKRDAQQLRIKEIAEQVRAKEELAQRNRQLVGVQQSSDEEDDVDGGDVVLRRRRLGRHAIPDAPLELVLADELQDSLRGLKPEGNLLKERYRNLLLNGKLEARKPVVHRKPRREVTEKWSYKDWTLK